MLCCIELVSWNNWRIVVAKTWCKKHFLVLPEPQYKIRSFLKAVWVRSYSISFAPSCTWVKSPYKKNFFGVSDMRGCCTKNAAIFTPCFERLTSCGSFDSCSHVASLALFFCLVQLNQLAFEADFTKFYARVVGLWNCSRLDVATKVLAKATQIIIKNGGVVLCNRRSMTFAARNGPFNFVRNIWKVLTRYLTPVQRGT